ncbi:8288_t:CDS:2 [Cetraspora pellucida]|uniref:8288_t:CDS:1 n=1 Tax=Cetraspora pellucida TaxID=1433469 RepID=A0A9N8VND1_9GLOM|nr:8288_t:CDS:2 [Cetraspora pellucida]
MSTGYFRSNINSLQFKNFANSAVYLLNSLNLQNLQNSNLVIHEVKLDKKYVEHLT